VLGSKRKKKVDVILISFLLPSKSLPSNRKMILRKTRLKFYFSVWRVRVFELVTPLILRISKNPFTRGYSVGIRINKKKSIF